MKTAVFMRHGHAAEGSDDHARELTSAGRLAARTAAEELRRQGFHPDVIMCSGAVRARVTAEIAADVFGGLSLDVREELYLCPPELALESVRALPDESRAVLLVAHNPGLEELGHQFGRARGLAPAGYFLVQRSVSSWEGFEP
jgi:phosphohistidine phosphatase